MACCCGNKKNVKEPQAIKSDSSPRSEKIKTITPKASANSEIEYTVTIKTGDFPNSGTEGPVYIKIFGRDDKQTEDLLLTNSSNDKSFERDSTNKFQVKAIDIGKPQRITIRHEDKSNGWYIDYVQISVHNFSIRFIANRWLSESKHDHKLFTELFGSEQPAVEYDIEIQTGNEQIEPLDSPVYMQIYGTTGTTSKLFLEPKSGSFSKDSISKFHISNNDVGEIQKIVIGHENLGTVNDWYLQNVKVQTPKQQQAFTANKWLSRTRDDKQLFIELKCDGPPPSIYLITVQTADVQRAETIDNIEMSIRGSNGQIAKTKLKEQAKSNGKQLFQRGSVDQFEIKHEDIGKIESITIGFNDNEQKPAWLLEDIDIKYKDTVYHFRAQCWLSSRLGPNFTWITVKPDTNNDDINYKIIIETGKSGIDANVVLCIYGDKDTTKNLALKQKQFDKNSHLEFDLKTIDIGKIKKINIGHDGQGNKQQWLLTSIEIVKKDEHYTFKADRWLNEEQGNYIDLFPEENKKDQSVYSITIETSTEDKSGTDSGVFMTIYGEKNRTKQFQLNTTKQGAEALFEQGKTNEFELELDDVGNITKINIGQDGKGLHPIWHLKTVQIQKGSEIYKFNADTILDYSLLSIDLLPVPPEKPMSTEISRSSTPEKKIKLKETIYKVSVQIGSLQQNVMDDDANLYIVIIGVNGETKRMPLSIYKKTEFELKTTDVGKILKILLGQDDTEHGVIWHVDNVIIKRGDEITTFNVERAIEKDSEIEVTPSPIREKPAPSQAVVKTKDTNYQIKISTGEKAFQGNVIIQIRGEYGIISIPLSTSKSGEIPFQSKATDEFTSRTTDVGKIRRITIEHDNTTEDNSWYIKKVQIIKGNEVYNFKANVRVDPNERKVNLFPIEQKKEDYVQSELRRLRENLRSESFKMRRPRHKAHEPFVYNDLSPYFDTTTVERAIHEPLETPPGYYTRLTALRIVEPWEAYGMDYGVNYELLKQRKGRAYSAKRPLPTQNGMMILPPLALPYGGQITYVNPTKIDRVMKEKSHSSSTSKRRSLSRQHHEQIQIATTTA